MKHISLFFLCLAVCTTPSSASVAPTLGQSPGSAKPEKKYVPYRITRGDRLSVSLLGEPDLRVGGIRVEAVGTVNLQLIQNIDSRSDRRRGRTPLRRPIGRAAFCAIRRLASRLKIFPAP